MLINHLLRIINTQNPIWHRLDSPPPTGGREKGKEKLDFAARTLSLNKQYLHSLHQICVKSTIFC